MNSQRKTPVAPGARVPLVAAPESDDLSNNLHRLLIGVLGLVMPILVWLIAGFRPTDGLTPWELLTSVSAYHYTAAVPAFSGVLAALAVFLYTYRGYDNAFNRQDRVAAIVAATAALLVAFFPTGVPDGIPPASWWTDRTGTIHNIGAATLFAAFIFFSLFLFPKSKVKDGKALPPSKRVRNAIHVFCGIAMVGCVLWALVAMLADKPIFWAEALALEFFAVSWLVKGRVDKTASAAGSKSLHYAKHPGDLVEGIRTAIKG